MCENQAEFGLTSLFDSSNDCKDSKRDEVAPPPGYRIPQWFLTHNVKTQEDLFVTSPQTRVQLLEDGSSGRSSPSVDRTDSVVEESDATSFALRCGLYEELRDMILDATLAKGNGPLPYDQPSILLCAQSEWAFDYTDAVLCHLARELSGDVISLDLEEFQDLALDFLSQDVDDKKTDSKKKLTLDGSYSYAYYYFATERRDYAAAADTKRNWGAVSALLRGPEWKRNQHSSDEEAKTGPLFVHLRDGSRLMTRANGVDLMKRVRETIEFKRKDGQKMVLLATVLIDNTTLSSADKKLYNTLGTVNPCQRGLNSVAEALRVDGASTLNLGNPAPKNRVSTLAQEMLRRIVLQLKRYIRERLDGKLEKDLTCPGTAWPIPEVAPNSTTDVLEKIELSPNDLRRASRQIAHRSLANAELTLKDIVAVLARMHQSTLPANPAPSKPPAPKSHSPPKPQTLQTRLKKLAETCTTHEKALLSRVLDPATLTTTYSTVITSPETIATVRQLLSLASQNFTGASSTLLAACRISGALFHGPPGTGKTLLARAMAKESGMAFLSVDSAALTDMYVGETEKCIAATFSLARKLAPCIVFIDEVDSLFYRRTSHDRSHERKALTQVLQELDGVANSAGSEAQARQPFVVVATNRARDLDEAFLRRLPHKVLFKLPGVHERERILRVFLKPEDLSPLVDMAALARQTEGFSGSDLKSLCGQAALAWATENAGGGGGCGGGDGKGETRKLCIGVEHFAKALERPGNPSAKVENAVGV